MILFSAARQNFNCQIYKTDDDGTNLVCLTQNSGLDWCQGPIISPNGRQITFFSVALPQLTNQYHVMDLNGSHLDRLPHQPSPNKIYGWLPDDRLIFAAKQKYWTAMLNGSKQEQLSYLDGYLIMDIFSAGHLAVIMRGTDIHKQIFIADLDKRTIQPLFSDGKNQHSAIQYPVLFSPNGKKIACIGGDEDEIWVVDLDSSNCLRVAEVDYFWHSFKWSHDSKLIAFVKSLGAGGPDATHGAICSVNIENTAQQIIVDRYIMGMKWCWSSDGKGIIYTTFKNGDLQIKRTDLSGRRETLVEKSGLKVDAVYDLLAASY